VFDSVVAVDSGVDQLFRHAPVEPAQVRDLVHGAMFTRGPDDLKNTAVFIGGSDVAVGEQLLDEVTKCFFGPMRVSVMIDSNGSNTTAAAAVLAAGRHLDLSSATVLVLPGTGPVGQRAVRLLAREGATVRVGSRRRDRSEEVCRRVQCLVADAVVEPHATGSPDELQAALDGASVVIAAGAAGIELLPEPMRNACPSLRVVVDLNAVPPLGIAGVEVTDKGVQRGDVMAYGAIGVGGTKMKIHRAALARLFQSNDGVLDAEEIYAIGRELES
jgi:NADPH:quinone reductase-like Zn-dependent oxidoreductase